MSVSSAEKEALIVRVSTSRMLEPRFLCLLATSLLLLVAWSFAVPMFEAPDEAQHWEVARYINQNHSLPFYDEKMVEANQAPLYYLLMAPFARPSATPLSGMVVSLQGILVPLEPPKITLNAPADLGRFWPLRISRFVTA